MVDGFTFFKSFAESGKYLNDDEKAKYYESIINYGLYHIEPPRTLPDKLLMIFELVKPIIDASGKRREGARKKWEKDEKEKQKNASMT